MHFVTGLLIFIKTLGEHWACVEIKKLEDERRGKLATQFQELFEYVYEFDKNYKFAIEKTFESFVANYDEFAPFPTRPTWALSYTYINFVWDYSFIKVCIFGKILNNAILVVSN